MSLHELHPSLHSRSQEKANSRPSRGEKKLLFKHRPSCGQPFWAPGRFLLGLSPTTLQKSYMQDLSRSVVQTRVAFCWTWSEEEMREKQKMVVGGGVPLAQKK